MTRRLIAFASSATRGSATWVALAVTASVLGSATARAANDTAANGQDVSKQELLQRLETMERRVQTLETRLKQQNQAAPASPTPNRRTPASAKGEATAVPADEAAVAAAATATTPTSPLGPLASPVPGLKFGMYGELKFGSVQNPAANGQWTPPAVNWCTLTSRTPSRRLLRPSLECIGL